MSRENYIKKVSCGDGFSILGIAVENNDYKLAKLLLEENGVDPDVHSNDFIGEYPLTFAIKNNNYNIVKLLLDNGAKVRYDEDSVIPPLIFASGEGNYEIVKLLLDKGANVNEVYENETTALFNAVIEKKLRITKLLLDNGADINWKDEDGVSALSVATKDRSYKIVKLLEKYILDKIILNLQRIAKAQPNLTIDIGFEIFLNLVKKQMKKAGSEMNIENSNIRKKLYEYFIKFNETTANVKNLKEQKGGSKRPRDSLCVKAKNLGIRLTRNVNRKRVSKTETMLRNEIKRK
jgi:ankyrin repeat protein